MKQETFLCPHCQRICDNAHNLEQHAKACIGIQMNTVHASRHQKRTYMQRKQSDPDLCAQENETERMHKQ